MFGSIRFCNHASTINVLTKYPESGYFFHCMNHQTLLPLPSSYFPPFKTQLLKWIGNKQRFAHVIADAFPSSFNRYFEPFLGSGAVMGTVRPSSGLGSDAYRPLVEIWQALKRNPERLTRWYTENYELYHAYPKPEGYEKIKASFNANPNPKDLLFISRSCYGGVIRFRKADGYLSTPCGAHAPISPHSFNARARIWQDRIKNCDFITSDFEIVMNEARSGDLIYCDPPYSCSQSILYGGQDFRLDRLLRCIARCRDRGVAVVLSIDGTKKSGDLLCDVPIPKGIFAREVLLDLGHSMLKRFQMKDLDMKNHKIKDRLLLTY